MRVLTEDERAIVGHIPGTYPEVAALEMLRFGYIEKGEEWIEVTDGRRYRMWTCHPTPKGKKALELDNLARQLSA